MVDFVLFNVNAGLNYTLFIDYTNFIIKNPIYLHIIT